MSYSIKNAEFGLEKGENKKMGICGGRAIVLQGYKQSLRFAATN